MLLEARIFLVANGRSCSRRKRNLLRLKRKLRGLKRSLIRIQLVPRKDVGPFVGHSLSSNTTNLITHHHLMPPREMASHSEMIPDPIIIGEEEVEEVDIGAAEAVIRTEAKEREVVVVGEVSHPSGAGAPEVGGIDCLLPQTPVGGRLKLFLHNWRTVTSDKWVLRTISEGYQLEFTARPPVSRNIKETSLPSDTAKRKALLHEVSQLKEKQAITQISNWEDMGFFSTFFLALNTLKKNGEWRPIINLKPLKAS